eukprot:1720934-Ditylum_brightwellii.AAC.1
MSDWFLDHVNNKYSFSEGFIKSLVPNAPTAIKDTMKTNLVKVIENMRNNYVWTITPKLENDVLKSKATLGNGAKEKVSDEWLKENYCTLYNYYYKELHDPENH